MPSPNQPSLEQYDPELSGVQVKIAEILAADRAAFDEWVSDPERRSRLDMPNEALRALIIPRRILELAEDPSKVNLVVLGQDKQSVEALVVERRSEPVSNIDSLYTYWEQQRTGQGELPPDADDYKARQIRLALGGILGPNDYVMNESSFVLPGNAQLRIDEYGDRAALRGQGVGKSFFGNLKRGAIAMGLRYTTALNNQQNIDFFRDTLGRYTLDQIRPEFWELFTSEPEGLDPSLFTVDIFYEEDKRRLLIDPAV